MITFNRWLGFICLNIVALGFLVWHNVPGLILASDVTFLSWVILAVYVITTASIGRKTYNFTLHPKKKGKIQNTNLEWYVRDELAAVGMIGTIIGLMIVLGPAFANIDPGTASTISEAISFISLGVGTALWTTVTALVSSVLIGIQLMNLEKAQKSV